MADESAPKPGSAQPSSPSQPSSGPAVDVSAAQPAQVQPGAQPTADTPQELLPEGVKTEGLVYTEIEGGLRRYADQEPVKTIDKPAEEPKSDDEKSPTTSS